MLPTVLRRWSCRYSWFLCGLVLLASGRFKLSLAFLFFLMFFQSCLALWSPRYRKRELVYVLLLLLFILHALNFVLLSSWCQGLTATCVCGILWTFLLTFLNTIISIRNSIFGIMNCWHWQSDERDCSIPRQYNMHSCIFGLLECLVMWLISMPVIKV